MRPACIHPRLIPAKGPAERGRCSAYFEVASPASRSERSERVGRRGNRHNRPSPVFILAVPHRKLLSSSHTSGSAGATSKLAPVVRCLRTLHSGASVHRELNRRDNPGLGRSGRRIKSRPRRGKDGKRKPGHTHAGGLGYNRGVGKAPPSRSDRPAQAARERVGRGSLPRRIHHVLRVSTGLMPLNRGGRSGGSRPCTFPYTRGHRA